MKLGGCFYVLKSVFIRAKIKFFYIGNLITRGKWYKNWIVRNESYDSIEMDMPYKPLISIILPVYNVKEAYLIECLNSVINQWYSEWELCIADDNSSDKAVVDILKDYEVMDSRIKVVYRKENGHISACSNSALELAKGEYIALLDNDDVLAPFALYEVVKLLNKDKDLDLIYSDEDKLRNGIRCYPFFKKKYDSKLLQYINYICHLAVYKTSIIKEIKGFRIGYEGVQDWDLALRVMKLTTKIAHIPKILYHWRMTDTSTSVNESQKPYVKLAKRKMLGKIK